MYELAAVLAAIAVAAAVVAAVAALFGRAAAVDATEPLPPEWVNDHKEHRT